jgi:hypothetical protein
VRCFDHSNAAQVMRPTHFVVEVHIRKTEGGGVLAPEGEVNLGNPGPMDRAQTHGTGLTGGVENTAIQMGRPERSAGITNGHNLGVRRRVTLPEHLVRPLTDNMAIPHDDTPKRPAEGRMDGGLGQLDCPDHGISGPPMDQLRSF